MFPRRPGGGRASGSPAQTQPCASFIRRSGVKTLAPHRSNPAAPAAAKPLGPTA